MSWEVRTMRSVTSCFNVTLFRKNLARFWPIWGLYGVIWFFLIPVALFTNRNADWTLSQALPLGYLPMVGLWMAALFGILGAMAVFSYLYGSRSVGLLHALPVRREALFLTNYLSGLAFFFLPHLAVFLIALATEALMGILVFSSLFLWLVAQSLLCLFFYSFAVFCAMFTGHILALPAFYGILNGLAYGLVTLFNTMAQEFLFGYVGVDRLYEAAAWLTPLLQLARHMNVRYDEANLARFSGLSYIFFYALVGVVLAVLALLVYRRRQLECAGDVVAVSWVRPVFKYGLAACCAVALGMLLYSIFYAITPHSPWTLLLFMLLSGALGYFIAEMLLRKTFRVFHRGWKGCVVLLVCLAAAMCVMELDLTGFERRLPDADQVASARISSIGSYPSDDCSYADLELSKPDDVALLVQLHQAIVDRKDELDGVDLDGWISESRDGLEVQTAGFTNFEITYQLKNGGTLIRHYALPITEEALNTSGSPAALLNQLINTPALTEQAYFHSWNENCRLVDITLTSVYDPETDSYTDLYFTPSEELLSAVREDLLSGDLGRRYLLEDEARLENCYRSDLVLTFTAPVSAQYNGRPGSAEADVTFTICIGLEASASRTLAVLYDAAPELTADRLQTHADLARFD